MEPSPAGEQPGQELHSPCQRDPLPHAEGPTTRRSPVPPRHPQGGSSSSVNERGQQQPGRWESWSTAVLPAASQGHPSRQIPPARGSGDAPGGARCQLEGGDRTKHPRGCGRRQGHSAELPCHSGTRDGSTASPPPPGFWDFSGHRLPQKRGCSCRIPSQPAWIPVDLPGPEQSSELLLERWTPRTEPTGGQALLSLVRRPCFTTHTHLPI